MSLRKTWATVLASAITIGVLSAASQAIAVDGPRTDAELISPGVVREGVASFTDDQIDAVWAAVVSNYPAALPEGYQFPNVAPAIFHPNDGLKHLFEVGLPDAVAAQYWRCAWLDAGLHSKSITGQELAKALETYWKLPSVPETDLTGLDSEALQAAAKALNFPTGDEALFALSCEGFEK
ncbi:hypothetical protein [Protaetiibacter intestinalis]|uniref:Uncharacterized protein n=1 Tax=Protaetiibacter intestinalis TaxID=2419774 RepID=A0A387B7N6_9MICO|nr:hypothetical protein [Protaetiibacter intestinalis]AYF97205.1 hypothetical protein D7I47_02365 [Protaetiibacter intestinalis]